jgi:hypothetical protein
MKTIKNWSKILLLGMSVMVLVFGLVVMGCKPVASGGAGGGNKDSIKITSVSPKSGLIDGQKYTFLISVDYNLTTQELGEIFVGFNDDERNINIFSTPYPDGYLQIGQGKGNHLFTISARAKNWGAQGDFCISATIDLYPRVSGTVPLAWDEYVLTFK